MKNFQSWENTGIGRRKACVRKAIHATRRVHAALRAYAMTSDESEAAKVLRHLRCVQGLHASATTAQAEAEFIEGPAAANSRGVCRVRGL